jgi:membrane-bound lytic murein transglycosylase A
LLGAAAAGLAAPVALASTVEFPRVDHRTAPLQFPDSQYEPLAFADIPGWSDDDQLSAFKTFAASCRSVLGQRADAPDSRPIGATLRGPCALLRREKIETTEQARAFFEQNFHAVRISKLGENEGFVTGYYEPIVDGSRTRTDEFSVPVYRRPSSLFVRGFRQSNAGLPNRGEVFRKVGRRKLVPFYDRGEIEDGALEKRDLELAWLKSATDLLFMQIQGSARIRFEDGTTLRLNYDAHNGYPYTPVGRILIERGIVPREEMSMQRIRQWMDDNPEGAKELRRQNRSFVFFREVKLGEGDEPVGAQGIPLTAGRSIAVDKALHVYGTPFFVEGKLPVDTDAPTTPFRKLMVAQDTGSAIVGPARADIYFGAGVEAGRVAGRMRHPARFVMLLPREIDPLGSGKTMPLPRERPTDEIAKQFPQAPAKTEAAQTPASAPAPDKPASKTDDVPLPTARPDETKPAPAPATSSHPPT